MFNLKKNILLILIAGVTSLSVLGCDQKPETQNNSEKTQSVAMPAGLFLDTAPQGLKPIAEIKSDAKKGDSVVFQVVVGGNLNPIVTGRGAMAVIASDLQNKCTNGDDHCKTPWDYCCVPSEDKKINMASVQVTDDAGKVLAVDLESKIKPLDTLIIKGIVSHPGQSLVIRAQGIYIVN